MSTNLTQMASAHAQKPACHAVHPSMHWLNVALMPVFLYKISWVTVETSCLGKKEANG